MVAEFVKRVDGVRRWARMPQEIPLSVRWVAKRLDLRKSTVHRALKDLEAAGVLRQTGSLPGRGGKRGTHTYAPVPVRHLTALPDPRQDETERRTA